MTQMNLNITDRFAQDLKKYMLRKGITNKSEALREAIHEVIVALEVSTSKSSNYQRLIGVGLKVPPRQKPRFKNEDALWIK